MKREKFRMWAALLGCVGVVVFWGPPPAGGAEASYPAKPIRLVVPFAAGGPTDLCSRKLADLGGKDLGQEIIVENKIGAGGTVGARFVAFSKPDGYTIGSLASSAVVIQPHLAQKLDFDPIADFVPLAQYAIADHPLAVPANSPIKTFKDFIEEGRKRELTYAGSGMTAADVAIMRLAAEAKIKLKIVAFAGMAPSITAVLGGHTDAIVSSGYYEYVRSGKLRLLAQTTAQRNKEFPDVPTLKELGYNIETRAFYGLVGPKGLPEAIREKLEKSFAKAIRDPAFSQTIHNASFTLAYRNGRDYAQYIKEVYEISRKEFQELGLGKYAKEKK